MSEPTYITAKGYESTEVSQVAALTAAQKAEFDEEPERIAALVLSEQWGTTLDCKTQLNWDDIEWREATADEIAYHREQSRRKYIWWGWRFGRRSRAVSLMIDWRDGLTVRIGLLVCSVSVRVG